VDGVSLARGAIGNPWVFRECLALAAGEPSPPRPTLGEQRQVMEMHFAEAIKYYGEKDAGRAMRRFGIKYCKGHPNAGQVRDAFVAVKSAADVPAVLDRWYPSE
jgi:tRNA-dihydrouridine synthase